MANTTTARPATAEAAIAGIVEKQEQLYRQTYPELAAQLDDVFYVDPDQDGRTFWLRNRRDRSEAEPFGSQAAAEEARKTVIMSRLAQRFSMDRRQLQR